MKYEDLYRFPEGHPPSPYENPVRIRDVGEVYLPAELELLAGNDRVETHVSLIAHFKGVVWVGHAIVCLPHDELMEMIVPPSHHRLKNVVQFGQGRVAANQDAPPDRRLAAVQCHSDLIDWDFGCAHCLHSR